MTQRARDSNVGFFLMLRCLPFYLFVKLMELGMGNLDKLGNLDSHQIFMALDCPWFDIIGQPIIGHCL